MGRFAKFVAESAIYDKMNRARDIDDPVDRAIAQYVLDPMYSFEVAGVIDQAIERYGNESAGVVYRGLNFSEKEDFDKFVADVQDGIVEFDSISSWAPTRGTAEQFARTKPSHMEFMSPAAWGEISKQSKAKERITGYRGVILSTTIEAGVGLDMQRTEYGSEREIILPGGKYRVEIEEIKTFKDILSDSSVDAEVAKLVAGGSLDEKETGAFLEYMFAHKPTEFSDKSKAGVFRLVNPEPFVYSIKVERASKFWRNTDTLMISMIRLDTLESLKPFLLQRDYNKLIVASRPVFKKMLGEIKSLYEPGMVIDWQHASPGEIADMLGLRSEYVKTMQGTIGKTYQDTSTPEHNRTLNTHAAIRAEADRVMRLLKSIG